MKSTDPREELVQAVLNEGGDAQQVVDRLQQAGFLVGLGQAQSPLVVEFPPELSYHAMDQILKKVARYIYHYRQTGVRVQIRHLGKSLEVD